MNGRHDRWLWAIIAIEIVVILALVGWLLLNPRKAAAPSAGQSAATTDAAGKPITLAPIAFAKGLDAPTAIAAPAGAGDKRLFVAERPGTVRVVDGNGKVGEPILDITASVRDDGGEQGLLGIALHPTFATTPYIYLDYVSKAGKTVVARYEFDPATGAVKSGSEKTILSVAQPYSNHNGGELQFGPDGYLYIALGDGGSAGDPQNYAQSKNSWLGKLLRIDVDNGDPYRIPATNPFANTAGAKPEVWAWGLRNPWRFSFDRQTGDVFIADVGQNTYEEINVQPRNSKGGENYGWRCFEGNHTFNADGCGAAADYAKPALAYAHNDDGRCSVTGGYVYRGTDEASLAGKYFYGDYCTGELFYAEERSGAWQPTRALDTEHAISTFGQDSAGELYYADIATGTLYRLTTDSAN